MGIVIFIVLLIVILVAVNEDSSKSFKNPTTNHESHDRFFKNALGEEVLVMSFFPSAEYANYFWHGMENIKERINKDGIFNFIEKDHPKLPFKMKSGYVKLETSWKDEKDEEFFMIFIVPKKHVDYFGQVYKEEFVEKKDEIKRLSEKGVLSDKEVIDIISIVFEMLNDVIHQEGHEMLIYTMNNVKLLCSKKTLPEDLNFIEEKIVFKMDNFNQKVEELTDNIKNLCHSNISQNDFNFIEKETINMMRIVFGTNKNNIKERFKELEKNIKAFYPKGMSQEELDFINKKLKHLEENINPLETFNDPLSISDSSDSFCLGDDTENTIIDTEFPSEETREEIQIDDAFVDDSFSTSGSSDSFCINDAQTDTDIPDEEIQEEAPIDNLFIDNSFSPEAIFESAVDMTKVSQVLPEECDDVIEKCTDFVPVQDQSDQPEQNKADSIPLSAPETNTSSEGEISTIIDTSSLKTTEPSEVEKISPEEEELLRMVPVHLRPTKANLVELDKKPIKVLIMETLLNSVIANHGKFNFENEFEISTFKNMDLPLSQLNPKQIILSSDNVKEKEDFMNYATKNKEIYLFAGFNQDLFVQRIKMLKYPTRFGEKIVLFNHKKKVIPGLEIGIYAVGISPLG